MGTIYIARHPIPLVGVAKGASGPSVLFDRIATPVRLREVDPGEMPLAITRAEPKRNDPTEIQVTFHALEGGLWAAVPDITGKGSRASFVDFLEGRLERDAFPPDREMFEAVVARTPLLALRRLGILHPNPGRERGPGDVKSTLARDDARAVANLHHFLAERVVLAGDVAYVRSPGPVATHECAESYRLRTLAVSRKLDSGVTCDPTRPGGHWEWYRSRPYVSSGDRRRFADRTPALSHPLPDGLPPVRPGDAWMTANEAPDECLARAWKMPKETRADYATRMDAIMVDAMWGAVGELSGTEAVASLERISAFAAEIAERSPRGMLAELGRRISAVDLPRALLEWPPASLDSDDEAALAAMSP